MKTFVGCLFTLAVVISLWAWGWSWARNFEQQLVEHVEAAEADG